MPGHHEVLEALGNRRHEWQDLSGLGLSCHSSARSPSANLLLDRRRQ
jgi:hypothetical protein